MHLFCLYWEKNCITVVCNNHVTPENKLLQFKEKYVLEQNIFEKQHKQNKNK